MSLDFAESIVDGFDDNVEGPAVLEQQAKDLGYDSIEEWAEALNMTVEDFYNNAEKNARDSITARTKAFEQLNKALGKTEDKIEKIGETANLSAG
jgi:hypothetical protein